MGFYENDKFKEEEDFYNEMDSSLFKVAAPIARMKYFIYLICLILLNIGVYAVGIMLSFFGVILIIAGVFLLWYVQFVINAERLWDITGDKNAAVTFGIISVLLNFVGGLGFLISLVLCLIPGKLIK